MKSLLPHSPVLAVKEGRRKKEECFTYLSSVLNLLTVNHSLLLKCGPEFNHIVPVQNSQICLFVLCCAACVKI
jgi:hypothetical protein